MPITEQQREERKRYIGSSDIGMIVGADEFRNASDLWLEKTGRLIPEEDSSEEAHLGNDLEEAALRMCRRKIRKSIVSGSVLPTLYDPNEIFCANLDAAILDDESDLTEPDFELRWLAGKIGVAAVVEAKTTGLRERWGDSADDVPLNVVTQTQWQMALAHCDLAYVPVFFPGGYRKVLHPEVYRVERNEKLIDGMRATAERFWNYVVTDTPPPKDFSEIAHVETLERRRRIQGEIVSLSSEAEEAWLGMVKSKERISALQSDVERYRRIILTALGDSEAGRMADGALITYFEQNGARHCDFDAMELECLELAAMAREVINPANASALEAAATLSRRIESLVSLVVRQGRHRTLRYKKPRVKAPK